MSRYLLGAQIPQPPRKIKPAESDILHTLKMGERLDNLAGRFYKNNTEGWIILAANPEYDNEFDIPVGTQIRIPWPLKRVKDAWYLTSEI